jgi:hypothetical protein
MCGTKLSISLLNTKTGFTTPWHCSVAQLADGVWVSAPMGEFNQDNRLELVHIDGKPSHYQERLHEDGITIGMTGANYLQSARPINMNQYVNGASRNRSLLKSLSSEVSLSSSEDSISGSTLTTQETQSLPEFESAQTGLCIPPDKNNGLTARPKDNDVNVSTPYGRRLIPQIMDSLADTEPDRTIFSLASVLNGNIKLNHVSARQFTRAVDKIAWWLRGQVGTPSAVQPVVYIGPCKFDLYLENRALLRDWSLT